MHLSLVLSTLFSSVIVLLLPGKYTSGLAQHVFSFTFFQDYISKKKKFGLIYCKHGLLEKGELLFVDTGIIRPQYLVNLFLYNNRQR